MPKVWIVEYAAIEQDDMEPIAVTAVCATQELAARAKRRMIISDWEQDIRGEPCFRMWRTPCNDVQVCAEYLDDSVYGDPPQDNEELEAIWLFYMLWVAESNATIEIREVSVLDSEDAVDADIVVAQRDDDSVGGII